jgi:hypothetical protein
MLICSPERPWGVHSSVHNDEDCPRCGWTAPGPKGDAIADAVAAAGQACADGPCWTVHPGDRRLAA